MPKAYSYLRFSTPEQERGDSFRRQSTMARLYAEKHGLELDESSYQDLGVSAFRGRNAETGALGEFLEAVRNGVLEKGSFLLVESLDRLSRDKPRKATRVLEDICEEGVTLVTLADGKEYTEQSLDDDPMAFMWAFMVATRANDESEIKSRRLKASWENKRAKASLFRLTGLGPQWLEPVEDPKGGFRPVPERAGVVALIFDMARQGKGQHAIAEELNRRSIPTFGRAAHWQRTYVAKILKNPAVLGTLIPHRIEYVAGKKRRIPLDAVPNYYPAVIDPEVYQEVQALRLDTASPMRGRHAHGKLQNILGGLAKCPHCDGTMTRVSKGAKGGKPYLVCSNAKQGGGCKYKAVPYALIEEAVLENLVTIGEEARRPGDSGEARQELIDIEEVLEAAQETEGRLYEILGGRDATQRDKLKLRELQVSIEDLESKRKAILDRIEAARITNVDVLANRLEELGEAAEPDREAINVALRKLLRGVTLDYEGPFHKLVFHYLGDGPDWNLAYQAQEMKVAA